MKNDSILKEFIVIFIGVFVLSITVFDWEATEGTATIIASILCVLMGIYVLISAVLARESFMNNPRALIMIRFWGGKLLARLVYAVIGFGFVILGTWAFIKGID